MNIYTSYFGNWRKWPKDAIIVSISRKTPLGFKGQKYETLAPGERELRAWRKGEISEDTYTEVYRSQLRRLDKWDVKRDLARLGAGHDVILVCYEKDGFCHRHLAAEWLGAEEFV